MSVAEPASGYEDDGLILPRDKAAPGSALTPTEGEGIEARWEFGDWMLGHVPDGGERLPKGFLQQLAAATDKSERELSYRIQFARQFPDKRNALRLSKSWFQIVTEVCPRSESGRSPYRSRLWRPSAMR